MWHLEMQTEKQGKNEIDVLCKHIRFFPKMGSTGKIEGFGKLKPLVLGLLLRSQLGYQLKLTMCVQHGDILFTSYTITHPDTMGKPEITIGQGKYRRKVKEELAPDVKIPGKKEKYAYQMDFEKRILQLGGPALLAEVIAAFVERRDEIMSKRSARLAA